MASAKVALRPKNEAPRNADQGERGTTNYNNGISTADSITTRLQSQYLVRCGVPASLIAVVSASLFGEAANV